MTAEVGFGLSMRVGSTYFFDLSTLPPYMIGAPQVLMRVSNLSQCHSVINLPISVDLLGSSP